MSATGMNDFLRQAVADASLRGHLRQCDAIEAAELARSRGFDVTVGDLTRYKARATTWQLTDPELAVVAEWQSRAQSYWWQYLPGSDGN